MCVCVCVCACEGLDCSFSQPGGTFQFGHWFSNAPPSFDVVVPTSVWLKQVRLNIDH